jgi:hypothetical protein
MRGRPGGRGVPSVVGRDQRPRDATCGGSAAANPLPYDTPRRDAMRQWSVGRLASVLRRERIAQVQRCEAGFR